MTKLSDSITSFKEGVDEQLKVLLKTYINEEISTPEWQQKIQNTVNQSVSRVTSEMLSTLDSTEIISDTIKKSLRLNDQDLTNVFSGIRDSSNGKPELVVMPECVVVENQLASRNIKNVGNIESKSLTVTDLSVTGYINVDNSSWQTLADNVAVKTLAKMGDRFVSDTADKVLEIAKKTGIEFDKVLVGNTPIINGNALSDKITDTNIKKTGTLKTLSVAGNTDIFDTLHVIDGRIGVNTTLPDMAINVWDQEVSISIGKISPDRAFVGSSHKNELALGVNRQGNIVIDKDGVTTISKLRVGRNAIGHADQVPGWSGTKGDFIINTSPEKDQVFAWICLGDYRWKALKAV